MESQEWTLESQWLSDGASQFAAATARPRPGNVVVIPVVVELVATEILHACVQDCRVAVHVTVVDGVKEELEAATSLTGPIDAVRGFTQHPTRKMSATRAGQATASPR